MARFTVRIELRDGRNAKVCQDLDRCMEAHGFTRFVRVQDGTRRRLPTAEYRITGRRTRAQVCRLAQAGAAEAAENAGILVTEGSCSWHNLRAYTAEAIDDL